MEQEPKIIQPFDAVFHSTKRYTLKDYICKDMKRWVFFCVLFGWKAAAAFQMED